MKDPRLNKLRKAIREKLTKSELLNFRMPSDRIELLYEIAERKSINISTLLRDWINEKIELETTGNKLPTTEEQNVQHLSELVEDLSQRLRVLEETVQYEPATKRKGRKKPPGT